MAIHELKTKPPYFADVQDGSKTFEVRRNDRGFQVGDYLILKEYIRETGLYTGTEIVRKVSYILDDPVYCKEGYIVMGIVETGAPHAE